MQAAFYDCFCMAVETTTSLSNFLDDMIIPMKEQFSKRTVTLDELRRNTRRSNFSGLQVRVPLLLNPKQGTGGQAETGGPNLPKQLEDRAAFIKMARISHPVELSLDLIQAVDRKDFVYAGDAVKLSMDQAEVAMSRVENEMLLGTGTGLLAAFTAGATSATQTVGTSANFYQLYAGRVVSLNNRTTGAVIAAERVIVSSDPVAGTVTFDASVTVATTDGIYIEGTFGNAIQGVLGATGTSGLFQGVDLATTPVFRSVLSRGAAPGAAALSMPFLNSAYRQVRAKSGKTPDFWVGDPASIDVYGESMISQFRWEPKITKLETGWEGIDYKGSPLIPDDDAPARSLIGINKSAVTFYGYSQGPDWDEQTGTKFQRFSRNFPVEAWLIDFVQLGIHQPGAIVLVANLNTA